MINHLVEVVLQGIWSSLTGGWFYDPHLSLFINTVHMYTWIILFLLPFFFYILFPSNFLTWSIYTLIIFVFFTIIKIVNYELNKMFDRNKILVDEKLVKLSKVKLKKKERKSKKRNLDKKNSRLSVARPILSQNNQSNLIKNSNLGTSRADSLVTSLKTIGNSCQLDTESNLNMFNSNNSNLDASISSKSKSKKNFNLNSRQDYVEVENSNRNRTNSSKSSTLSSSSNCSNSNELENQIESNYEQIKKEPNNIESVQNELNLEENSNRSLFKISEESLHLHANINQNMIKKSKILSTKTEPFEANSKSAKTVVSSLTVPNVSFSKTQIEKLEQAGSSTSWLNSNSYTELNQKAKKHKEKLDSNLKMRHQLPPLRRAKSDLSFSLFEKIIKKSQLNFNSVSSDNELNNKNDDEQNPNSIYESIDGESSKNLNTTKILKQSKTVNELYSKYKTESELFEKKLKFLTTHSLNLDKDQLKFETTAHQKKLGAKSFHNLNELVYSNSNLKSIENLKQFKNTLECIKINKSFSLESIKKKFLSLKSESLSQKCSKTTENEYQSIPTGSKMDLDLIQQHQKEYEKQGAIPKTRRPVQRQRSRGRKIVMKQTNQTELYLVNERARTQHEQPMVIFSNRNLAQSASHAAKIIKRDLIDRFKNTRQSYRFEHILNNPHDADNDDDDEDDDDKEEEEEEEHQQQEQHQQQRTIRFDDLTNKQRRRSSKFKHVKNDQLEFDLDSKLTPQNQKLLRSKPDSESYDESEDEIETVSNTKSMKVLNSRTPRNRAQYENFMEIIQLNDDMYYENDDQMSDNDYNLLELKSNRARSSKSVHYQHNSQYRLRKEDEEVLPIRNFNRSRSENYSHLINHYGHRNLLRTRLRFTSRRSQPETRLNQDTIDINAYHVILPNSNQTQSSSSSSSSSENDKEIKKKIYKLPIGKNIKIKMPFDHFSLMAMLDKNSSFLELILTVLIAVLVSVMSGFILNEQIYDDLYLVIFCFIVASCHYSLLKSVQPDSSSPIHGFNRLTAVSRPIYFCLICSLILILKYILKINLFTSLNGFKLYNFSLNSNIVELLLNLNEIFLLFFPFVFTFGLLPQISTFLLCLLEQIDMFMFGGTSMSCLMGAFLSLLRSTLACLSLSLVLYSSLFTIPGFSSTELTMSTFAAQNNQFSQTVLFSFYIGMLVVISYLLSRQTSHLTSYFRVLKNFLFKPKKIEYEIDDPFETLNEHMIKTRLESDLITSFLIFIFIFALHVSTLFTVLKPWLTEILFISSLVVGILNNYIIPHLRLENPWFVFNQPLLKSKHWFAFEPSNLAKLEWFERLSLCLNFFEKNILNVLIIINSVTCSSDQILLKYDKIDSSGLLACFVITCLSVKLLRCSFCEPSRHYKIFIVSYLFNKFDSKMFSAGETILFDLYIISIIMYKLNDFLDKLEFIFVYTAPWQLPWGSAFHAFAQPLFAPHTSLLILQTFLSSIMGAPLMPLMGSAIFLLSYMRPVKFWEKNYKTKRMDNSNMRLNTQFDTHLTDSENLNSIFYEHLSSVLQKSLCGDLMLGRWGKVQHGDFFILSSDYLNCLVHIIEIGNGFVTFQLRGLEFKGTYCQQRELEAITEENSENDGFCCCKIGKLKYMLSFNAAFHLRWVAWSVVSKKYIVDAYRIVDNDLSLIVNFYSLRRTLIDFYIKSSIFYAIKSQKLIEWLNNENIKTELEKLGPDYLDYDTCFDSNLDLDYDTQLKAVSMAKFSNYYSKWINYCKSERLKDKEVLDNLNKYSFFQDDSSYSLVIRFCFALSLVCRRALITACTGSNPNHTRTTSFAGASTHNNNITLNLENMGGFIGLGCGLHPTNMDSDSLSSFQHGYYTLFKGDIRIQSPKDEWVFNDMEILNKIALPAVRMGLRLHQDHFQNDSNDEKSLFDSVVKFDTESIICYERDPKWRRAVLSSVPYLLSLRHQFTEYSDQYKVVMLNKNFLSFRVIKINKECVRSFWAGQQHELIFLRNKNQERGSIQNAKQVLRNIINSSCDQPIGYPIYVSPLITSYSSTHKQIAKIIGPEFSFIKIFKLLTNCFRSIRENCTNDCSGNAELDQSLNHNYSTRTDQIQLNHLSPSNLRDGSSSCSTKRPKIKTYEAEEKF